MVLVDMAAQVNKFNKLNNTKDKIKELEQMVNVLMAEVETLKANK